MNRSSFCPVLSVAMTLLLSFVSGCGSKPHVKITPVSSLHMKMKSTLHPQPRGTSSSSSSELWYSAADRLRQDIIEKTGRTIVIVRGATGIQFSTRGQAVVRTPSSASTLNRLKSFAAGGSAAALARALGAGSRVVGEETVSGRRCDVVESRRSNARRQTFCLDQKTGILLRTSESVNGKPFSETVVTLFEPDTTLPSDVFQPRPPVETPVVKAPFVSEAVSSLQFPPPTREEETAFGFRSADLKHLSDRSAVSEYVRDILSTDIRTGRKSKLQAVYEPIYIPPRFRVLLVHVRDVAKQTKTAEGIRSFSYDSSRYNGVEITYIDPKTGDALILTESADAGTPDTTSVAAKGFGGKIRTRTKPFPYAILTWSRGGVYFKLGAVDVSEAELVRIARSLRPVETPG